MLMPDKLPQSVQQLRLNVADTTRNKIGPARLVHLPGLPSLEISQTIMKLLWLPATTQKQNFAIDLKPMPHRMLPLKACIPLEMESRTTFHERRTMYKKLRA